jgi:hypothetical protein
VEERTEVGDKAVVVVGAEDLDVWGVPEPPDPVVTASAQVVGTACPTRWGNPATIESAHAVERP